MTSCCTRDHIGQHKCFQLRAGKSCEQMCARGHSLARWGYARTSRSEGPVEIMTASMTEEHGCAESTKRGNRSSPFQ